MAEGQNPQGNGGQGKTFSGPWQSWDDQQSQQWDDQGWDGQQAQPQQQWANPGQAVNYQCPNCGGVMTFDAVTGQLRCSSCGYVPADAGASGAQRIPVGDRPVQQRGEVTHARTVEDFLERAPWEVSADGTVNAITYSCPSCAAEVVADQSVVSTECPYCGNVMLVSGTAREDDIPDYVLPFSLERRDAEARMRQHFEHKWYLPRAFDASLEHIRGVYVPYHLYDYSVSGQARYLGKKSETTTVGDKSRTVTYTYDVRRSGHARFHNIPVDGSSKMPDGHMDAIAPFDFDRLQPFSADYVAGYLSEIADEDADTCEPKARRLAVSTFESDLADDARDGLDSVEVREHQTNVTEGGRSSCMLPVWLMHCSWSGNQMLFAVNGETGKCVGDLPIDKGRRLMTVAATLVVALLLALFVSFNFLADEGAEAGDSFGLIVGSAIFAVIVAFITDSHFMGQMRTAVEAKWASSSYADGGLHVTERWRSNRR